MSGGLIYAKIEIDTDKDGLSDYEEQNVYFTNPLKPDTDQDNYPDAHEIFYGYSPLHDNNSKLKQITLDLPFIKEAPDGNWTGPWKNGCEEASITMIEKFYLGQKNTTIAQAKNYMMMLFTNQNKIWGSNADADAYRTAKLINDYTSYNALIKDDPTIDEIKKELQQKRPVISLHYGKDLQNPNIPFLTTGSYYHMIVIIGYDDLTKEFITHDNGDIKTGSQHRYDYDLFMNSLHDFDFSKRQANGPARVIFTYPKLVKLADYHRIYYLHDNIKQYVTHPVVFANRNWDWNAINIVNKDWLDKFINGPDLVN